jgi:hypothetical protein
MPLKEVSYIKIDDEKGILYAAGRESILLPRRFVEILYQTFAALTDESSAEFLSYKIGESIGKYYPSILEEILKKEEVEISFENKIKIACNAIFMESGLGKVKIKEIDLKKERLKIEIQESPSQRFLRKKTLILREE